ncbi:hypothetical protein F5Y12DRAFT_286315 [Xylaria sp. FL1777]|nr:hypothetical protein F5Y12DRAFT_286315 [Xylaria sp. FL1777]
MPPIQNTFSIIPDVPSAINAAHHGGGDSTSARPSRPPMTTKQVKKAYQKASKGPKLSKAEQRRQELFEQDRIRQEFEKEKNQARARAARDKKKEKEERERAEKKKKGLPLVDVRASQDTIARFVRAKPKNQREPGTSPSLITEGCKGDGGRWGVSPRPVDSEGSGHARRFDDTNKENIRPHGEFGKGSSSLQVMPIDNGHGLDDGSSMIDHAEPLNKKRKIDILEGEEEKYAAPFSRANRAASPSSKSSRKASIAGDRMKGSSHHNVEQSGLDLDDSFLAIDFSEEDLLDDLIRETESVHTARNALKKGVSDHQQGRNPSTESSPAKPPENRNHAPSPPRNEKPPYLERTAVLSKSVPSPYQLILPAYPTLDTMVKKPHRSSIPGKVERVSTPHSVTIPPTLTIQTLRHIGSSSRSFRHPKTPITQPPAPPKFRPSKQTSTSHPRAPQFLKSPLCSSHIPTGGTSRSRITKPEQVRENKLPPSTQLFILSHLDDLLPSPSQEVREIFEDPKGKHEGKHTENGSKAQLTGTHPDRKTSKPLLHVSKVSTTSYNRRVIPIPTVHLGRSHQNQQIVDYPKPRGAAPQLPVQPILQNSATASGIPFFSTQDLFLSSQDVKDIEYPLPLPEAQAPTFIPQKDCIKPRDLPRSSPKPCFTSPCREMQYKYAIGRNRTATWESPSAQLQAREELDQFQALEDERLELLLANPIGEGEKEQKGIAAAESCVTKLETARKESNTQLHNTATPRAQLSHLASLDLLNGTSWSSMPSSGSISEGVVANRTPKLPGAQQWRSGSSRNGRMSQRTTRPKSSYEAMLQLLAKGPMPLQHKQQPTALNGHGEDAPENRDTKNRATEEYCAMTISIPASQETDYDCGEEWDDEDLLRDIL